MVLQPFLLSSTLLLQDEADKAQESAGERWLSRLGEARGAAEWPGSGPIVFRVTPSFLSEPPEGCFLPSACGSAVNKSATVSCLVSAWRARRRRGSQLNQQNLGVAHGKLPARAETESR